VCEELLEQMPQNWMTGEAGPAMKISIVTLSFNQQRYLKEAIDSVLQQQYPELEYIVVDPGSGDGSRELIESYGERIAARIFEPDRGAADGLNKGFARATGDIFAFLNADDLLLPDALQLVAQKFAERPDIDIVMGNGYVVDGEGKRMKHVRARQFTVRRYFYGGCRWLQQATFFRRSAFVLTRGFNVENRTCWDGELFVSMVAAGARVGYLNRDLASFRIHGTSISGSGQNMAQYRNDSRRIFNTIVGHKWGAWDEVLRAYFRAEIFLRDRLASGQAGA
jgi:glycosyltransferase involved in cell wall biosynthesis